MYQAVSEGQRYPGMEHWLPFFHDHLETLFDYAGEARLTFDHLAEEAIERRFELVDEHYLARVEGLEAQTFGAPPYKPVPAEAMYVGGAEWRRLVGARETATFAMFHDGDEAAAVDMGGRRARNFTPERQADGADLFGTVIGYVKSRLAERKRVIVASWTPGARERMTKLLSERGLDDLRPVANYGEAPGPAR